MNNLLEDVISDMANRLVNLKLWLECVDDDEDTEIMFITKMEVIFLERNLKKLKLLYNNEKA